MALVINTNVSSLLAQRRLSVNSSALNASMDRLSSGFRINRAADDAAGLTISKNLESQIRRMKQASRNTTDGISLLQVAEGAMSVITNNLQRIRELTVQAANDTYDTASRAGVNAEVKALLEDIDRIAKASNFNGINLLDGTFDPTSPQYDPNHMPGVIQVGPNSDPTTNTVDVTPVLRDITSAGLGIVGAGSGPGFLTINNVDLADNATAQQFLTDLDEALNTLNLRRANIGSYQNRLESVLGNLDMAIENFSISNSRIRDVDIAEESANMVQSRILTESATMVLAQTNNLPQMVLRLLQK